MKLQFNPRTIQTVWLDVWDNPMVTRRSKNNPVFNGDSLKRSMENRAASYLAELLANIAAGNGATYGAKGTVDVHPDIEVKWSRNAWRMIARNDELKPGFKFILATGYPEIELVGWARSEEFDEVYPNHPRGARFIRREKLHAIESIF